MTSVLKRHLAADQVGEGHVGRSSGRGSGSPAARRRRSGRAPRRRHVAAGAAILRRPAGRERRLAIGLELLRRAEAVVGVLGREQLVGVRRDRGAAAPTAGTARAAPPTSGPSSQSRPSQRRSSRMPASDSRVERSASVSSMRRMKRAVVAAREQPVEQRGARVADVQLAGRAGCESDSHLLGTFEARGFTVQGSRLQAAAIGGAPAAPPRARRSPRRGRRRRRPRWSCP